MLGLGWTEILVIAVVALIVVGPKDLPVMLRNAGRAFGTVRRMSNEFRRELDKIASAEEMKAISRSVSDPITQTRSEISREFNQMRNGKVSPSGAIKPKEGQDTVFETLSERAGKPTNRITAQPQMTALGDKAPEDKGSSTASTSTDAQAATENAATGSAKPAKVKASRTPAGRAPGGSAPAKAKPSQKSASKTNAGISGDTAEAQPGEKKTSANKSPARKSAAGKSGASKPAAEAARTSAAASDAGEKRAGPNAKSSGESAGKSASKSGGKSATKTTKTRKPAAKTKASRPVVKASDAPASESAAAETARREGQAGPSTRATPAPDRALANADSGENS